MADSMARNVSTPAMVTMPAVSTFRTVNRSSGSYHYGLGFRVNHIANRTQANNGGNFTIRC